MSNTATDREPGVAVDSGAPFQITLNGAPHAAPAGTTLGGLLRDHALDPRTVVVERNGVILRDRASFDSLALDTGDVIEIVHFVGGG